MVKNKARYQFLFRHILHYKVQFIAPMLCMLLLAIITPVSNYLSISILMDEVLKLNEVRVYEIPIAYLSFQWSQILDPEWLKFAPKILFNYCLGPFIGQKWYHIFGYIIIPIFLLKAILSYSRTWRVQNIGNQIICDFQRELYYHFLHLPLSFFNKSRTGEISSRITSDVYRIQEILTDVILQTFQNVLMVICTFICLIVISPKLTCIALLGVPIAMAPILLTTQYLKKKSRQSQENTADINSHIFETISSIKIIKIFFKESYENSKFNHVLNRLLKTLFKSSRIGSISSPLVEFLSLAIVALFVGYGCQLIEKNEITQGHFIAFIMLVFSLFDPIKRLSRTNSKIANGQAALDRIVEMLAIKGEEYYPPNTIDMPPLKKGISFENLSFAYENQEEKVLKSIQFFAPVGKTTALVGLSGSGKTTLVNLLPCFFEIKEGDILIDGVSIKKFNLPSVRKNISLVSQDIQLFNETIAYNIGYGKEGATEEQIVAAAKEANAHEFIIKLPQGYQTLIGEKGSRLSGGQKQRISIARALLADTPILILDEATSALDVQSEKLIQGVLDNLIQNKTTFVIAHRLTTVKNADQIVVLDKGRIESIGKHEELLSKKGLYQNLYHTMIADQE